MRIFFGIASLFLLSKAYSSNLQFRVDWMQDRVEILSPEKRAEMTSLVVSNQTLSKVFYRVGNEKETFKPFSLAPGKTIVIDIPNSQFEAYSLIPLSPSAKEVPLRFARGQITLKRQ